MAAHSNMGETGHSNAHMRAMWPCTLSSWPALRCLRNFVSTIACLLAVRCAAQDEADRLGVSVKLSHARHPTLDTPLRARQVMTQRHTVPRVELHVNLVTGV